MHRGYWRAVYRQTIRIASALRTVTLEVNSHDSPFRVCDSDADFPTSWTGTRARPHCDTLRPPERGPCFGSPFFVLLASFGCHAAGSDPDSATAPEPHLGSTMRVHVIDVGKGLSVAFTSSPTAPCSWTSGARTRGVRRRPQLFARAGSKSSAGANLR